MRVLAKRDGRRVLAVSGKRSVVLAMRWPEEEIDGLLGFAIRRRAPDRSLSWLKTVLRFDGYETCKGCLYDSDEAPIQSMIWMDLGLDDDVSITGLDAGSRYTYEVFPVRGSADAPERDTSQSVRVTINTEPEFENGRDAPEVHFNRGLSSMQEYARLFGEGEEPEHNPKALAWLARDLETAIVSFVGEALDDETLLLDVAAFHLTSPAVLSALEKVGSRLRISLDWGPEERGDEPGPNGPAYDALVKARATVHQREHVSISHNKYMVLKKADNTPVAVLTGSTNFTSGGISTQSNQSVIIRNPELAAAFVADFERVLKNDNAGLRCENAAGVKIDDTLEVYFSPHKKVDRPDLKRLEELAKNATSSRLFMTFRMTDDALVSALLEDDKPVFGVVDRVYRGADESGDRQIYDEAFSAAPRIVACNSPLDDEPDEGALLRELKRVGYSPLLHHKVLLLDWDKPNCVVVTGSANYSTNSTQHNDENSVIIHGDQRLAEEYFVEFCRLFVHWRSRWLRERERHAVTGAEHLSNGDRWTDHWAKGGRLAEFLDMAMGEDATVSQSLSAPGIQQSLAGERIRNVVVLMMENRSFDQMLGQLPGVDGVRLGKDGKSSEHVNFLNPQNPVASEAFPVMQARYFGIPEGDIPPPTIRNGNVSGLYGGPAHSFPAASQQVYNDSWGPYGEGAANTTPAQNSGFVKAYDAALRRTYADWAREDKAFKPPKDPPRDHVEVVMASFSPDQLPVINGLASEFCVCDKWFSEVPGPTEPNRLFVHAGTSVGFIHNPWEQPIHARTVYEDIDEEGSRDWAFYFHDLSDSDNFPALKKRVDRVRSFDKFYSDLKNADDFPAYTFLCPRYADSKDGFANSQHAPYDVRYGEHLIADVYEALRASDIWEQTLLVVTYDEHGGFFDHVYPPSQEILPPDGRAAPNEVDRKNFGYMFSKHGGPKPQYRFNFDRLGCRVPTVLISPWLDQGLVESSRLQHTSIMATLRRMWGLRPHPLTAREGQAAVFDHLFEKRATPRKDCPKTIPRPPLPDHSLSAALNMPLSPVQREVFDQVLLLDGHPNSGNPVEIPASQREASEYIAERRRAHDKHHQALGAAKSEQSKTNGVEKVGSNGRANKPTDRRPDQPWRRTGDSPGP